MIVHDYTVDEGSRRVLLVNPPVYDMRLPWSQWQQPVALLQLATLLRQLDCDVRLVDTLVTKGDAKLSRQRKRILHRGDVSINYWRFGELPSLFAARLLGMVKDQWEPEEVYVEGFVTYWWEGVAEAVDLVRRYFPKARIILLGAYPQLAPQHSLDHTGADTIISGSVVGTAGLPTDLSLYGEQPSYGYISIGAEARSVDEVIDEIIAKAAVSAKRREMFRFAFADHDVISRYPNRFRQVLQVVADRKLKVAFYLLGNVYAKDIAQDPDLVGLFKRASVKQIVFADDREIPMTHRARGDLLREFEAAAEACRDAGYSPGTETISTQISVGRLGEELTDLTAFMAELSHIIGSLIPVPYQPNPDELPSEMPLEMHNGKLFPLAERNGFSHRAYQDVIGLAALLNAKYRGKTFDFMGDSLISRLVRSSLEDGTWDPRLTDSLTPRKPITIGYFNKEGKWVRS